MKRKLVTINRTCEVIYCCAGCPKVMLSINTGKGKGYHWCQQTGKMIKIKDIYRIPNWCPLPVVKERKR